MASDSNSRTGFSPLRCPLPKGFDSWLTYAVLSFGYREAEQLWLFDDVNVSREAIRTALWAEFNEIRAKAGLPYIEPSYRSGPLKSSVSWRFRLGEPPLESSNFTGPEQ